MKHGCTIVNINDDDCDVYIGRPSKWGNPYKIGEHGDRDAVINLYKEYVLNTKELMDALSEIEGKVLGCHCHPKPCHGDVLIELVNSNIEEYNLQLLLNG